MSEDIIYFEGPKSVEDYNRPNIHDIDPYEAIHKSILAFHDKKEEKEIVRKLPDSIKLINSETIEFTLNDVDPYCTGEKLYRSPIVRLKYGLNVLVGKNGSGKSTILRCLRDALNDNNYKYFSYDNIQDGGSNSISRAGFYGDYKFMANMIISSEGEGIMENFAKVATAIGKFIRTSKKEYPGDPVFIIMDAIDSGLSINNIIRLKDLFNIIHEDCGKAVIITSCNTFELAKDSYCWSVKDSKPISFKSYNSYHKFICKQDEDIINGVYKG